MTPEEAGPGRGPAGAGGQWESGGGAGPAAARANGSAADGSARPMGRRPRRRPQLVPGGAGAGSRERGSGGAAGAAGKDTESLPSSHAGAAEPLGGRRSPRAARVARFPSSAALVPALAQGSLGWARWELCPQGRGGEPLGQSPQVFLQQRRPLQVWACSHVQSEEHPERSLSPRTAGSSGQWPQSVSLLSPEREGPGLPYLLYRYCIYRVFNCSPHSGFLGFFVCCWCL